MLKKNLLPLKIQTTFLSDSSQSAKEMINKGVALWLPQMKEVKPDGATVDLVEVSLNISRNSGYVCGC